jgi:two-component system, OmpR family, KDP operon response regulator KdpE
VREACALGLPEVLCHFKVVNERSGEAVTEAAATGNRIAPMGDPTGHAATRILVVDDEPSIRLLCRVNLELDGHEVLEADSLGSARETLAAEDVDLVVLDVHLQRERSDALVAECHARRPPIPVVLVTGSVDVTHPGLHGADAVLPKPFELDQLLSTVSRLAREHAPR